MMHKFTTIDTYQIGGVGVVHTGPSPADFNPREDGWFEKLTAEPWEVDGKLWRVKNIERHMKLGPTKAGDPIGIFLDLPPGVQEYANKGFGSSTSTIRGRRIELHDNSTPVMGASRRAMMIMEWEDGPQPVLVFGESKEGEPPFSFVRYFGRKVRPHLTPDGGYWYCRLPRKLLGLSSALGCGPTSQEAYEDWSGVAKCHERSLKASLRGEYLTFTPAVTRP